MKYSRPVTPEQLQKLAARSKPTQDAINSASDSLFQYLLERVAELEAQLPVKKK